MQNIYNKGRRKEYAIIDDLKKQGFDIVQRTAGSHSPIDIIAINIKSRVIKFIQSKRDLSKTMKETNQQQKQKIEDEMRSLNNAFRCEFEVM